MQLFHRDLGGAGRPPLVILHGMLGSSRNWQTAGRDLAKDFHVYALDLRNHGNSPAAEEMSHAAMMDDVLAWLETRNLQRATLLGHSMGGKVAMLLACRHADRVEKLIAVDVAPKDYHWPERRRELAAMRKLDLERLSSRAEAERQWEADVPDWGMRKFLSTNLERTSDGKWRWQINLPALTAALSALEENPLVAGDRFAGPTLVITGGKSHYVQPADWPAVVRHFPAAQLQIIAEAGHNPHFQMREAFVRIVRDYSFSPTKERLG